MGIKIAAEQFIVKFSYGGKYNQKATTYNVYVDGELMRFKGLVEMNMTQHQVELEVAKTSFSHLQKLLKQVTSHMLQAPQQIYVYMDGKRVSNKEVRTNTYKTSYDEKVLRAMFMDLCTHNGMKVVALDEGESELMMFLQRDRTTNLNMFMTCDSDMLSIMYGHKPTIACDGSCHSGPTSGDFEAAGNNCYEILDRSLVYTEEFAPRVTDSAVWYHFNKEIFIGMDYVEEMLQLRPLQFRTLMACCGTDFTNAILTETMARAFLNIDAKDIEYINGLTDLHEIVGCFIMLGVRVGQLKVLKGQTEQVPFDANAFIKVIKAYTFYIETGCMTQETLVRQDMATAVRQYIAAMRNGNRSFALKEIRNWSIQRQLCDGIAFLLRNIEKGIKLDHIRHQKMCELRHKKRTQFITENVQRSSSLDF